MTVRAKFWCCDINNHHTGNASQVYTEVKMAPVYNNQDGNPANSDWSKYTPQGSIVLGITNPDAISQFTLGEKYYIDISPAEA